MDWEQYRENVFRTVRPDLEPRDRLLSGGLGLCGEAKSPMSSRSTSFMATPSTRTGSPASWEMFSGTGCCSATLLGYRWKRSSRETSRSCAAAIPKASRLSTASIAQQTHRSGRRKTSEEGAAVAGAGEQMIRKVLVANRGEIACRIMRTCDDMGIATVAVFSDADSSAPHVQAAGEAIRLGSSLAADSYLNSSALLEAAQRSGADAIHPGYGFLSENADFARVVQGAGITFIGPDPDVIARMGSKREAKLLMLEAGIPIVPGYLGEDQSEARFLLEADAIEYPIMIKASAGGGGKGMRLVADRAGLPEALQAARREALAAFGDDLLILEKSIVAPRHIEFQIFGDIYGNIIHLGERECTIQRRHQKVIEETPSTALTSELRTRMGEAAVMVGQQLQYTNAGTVEFIVDRNGNFYFLEVNTRLQVEHPVTELVTGLDLVRWQILVAEGRPLPLGQESISFSGHAIEARVYAEDPAANFLPVTGQVLMWRPPTARDVRVDAGIQTGDVVSTYYDPLLAKISAWGRDRKEALRRLDQALATTRLLGLPSNIAFLRRLLQHPSHLSGDITTGFIRKHASYLLETRPSALERQLAAAAIAILHHPGQPDTPASGRLPAVSAALAQQSSLSRSAGERAIPAIPGGKSSATQYRTV